MIIIKRYDNGEGVRVMEIPFNLPVICPIIIGRTSELTTLRLLIEGAKSGKGHVALISGEAGIGKSRLIAEAKTYATAQEYLVVQGNCFPSDLACPYATMLDLLRSLLANSNATTIIASLKPFARDFNKLLLDVVSIALDLL